MLKWAYPPLTYTLVGLCFSCPLNQHCTVHFSILYHSICTDAGHLHTVNNMCIIVFRKNKIKFVDKTKDSNKLGHEVEHGNSGLRERVVKYPKALMACSM